MTASLESRFTALRGLLDELTVQCDVPGASVAVRAGDEMLALTAGVASLDTGVEVTDSTMFQIGSTIKPMTATAVMQLVDDHLVDLDAPVTTYLPHFTLIGTDPTSVTVRHLLSHTGGFLGDLPGRPSTSWDHACLADYVASLASVPQLHPVGEMFSYANSGMVVLGRIIEVITGLRFDDALENRLLHPLGMAHTALRPRDIEAGPFAIGHRRDGGSGRVVPNTTHRYRPGRAPSGSMLACTASDMLLFAGLHLNDGRTSGGRRLLSAGSVRRMQQQHAVVPPLGATFGYGLGWALSRLADGSTTIGHHGTTDWGHVSAFELVPSKQIAIAVLSNAPNGRMLNQRILDHVFDELVGAPMATLVSPPLQPTPIDPRRYVGTYDGLNLNIDVEADGQELRATVAVDLLEDEVPPPEEVVLIPVNDETFMVKGHDYALHFLGKDDSSRAAYVSALGRVSPRQDHG